MKTICLPFPNESAASFALRIARKVGLSLQEFCQFELGLSYSQATSDLDQLLPRVRWRELSQISDTDGEIIREMVLPRDWIQSSWNPKCRRHQAAVHVCAECLKENFYGRKLWRTRFALACPKHGVEMINRCPQCGYPVTYFSAANEPLVAHWLENFPTCQNCLKQIDHTQAAHPIMLKMSKYWANAVDGQPVLAINPRDFLRLSCRCIRRFETVPRYRAVFKKLGPLLTRPEVEASALLLHAILHGPMSTAVFHAAIGSKFHPASLARELKTAWHLNSKLKVIPNDSAK